MPRVLNQKDGRLPAGAIYVGRPTKWGNPYKVQMGQGATDRAKYQSVVNMYREWLLGQPHLVDAIKDELKGKDLVCWCKPMPCHADVLLEIANS